MPVLRARLRALVARATLVAATALVLPTLSAGAAPRSLDGTRSAPGVVDISLLNIADFHGNLETLSGGVGGAAVLSAYFAQERERNPHTILFTSGDAVGASPPVSSFFADRPTVEWMNDAGFDVYTLGNHDFDAGVARIREHIDAAAFRYVSANIENRKGELPASVTPYKIVVRDGVKVAMIGVTNPETPTLAPGRTGSLHFTDPVAAAQRARAAAQEAGATVFVAFAHLGVTGKDASGGATGPLVDFARAVSGFDVVVGDHTDVRYASTINGALVTQNRSLGRSYSRTTLSVERSSGRVLSKDVEFVTPLASGVTPDPVVAAKVAEHRRQVQVQFDGPLGVADGLLPRGGTPAVERVQEVAVGNLTTDAMRAAYGTRIAFTNGGGLRSSLPSGYLPADTGLRRPASGYAAGPPYDLVLGDAYTLHPFGNVVVTRTVTGAQLWSLLEHGVSRMPNADGRFPQVSGFRFSYDARQPVGSRVLSVTLDDGTELQRDSAQTMTAATNDFLNAGGDGYTVLVDGQGVTRNLLAAVVADHVRRLGTVSPEVEGRITRVG